MEIETVTTPERLREDVQLIKEWMSKQPHLPKVEDEEWLITIMHHNKYNLEKTKTKLDKYFSFRTKYPKILKNRDPARPETLQAMAAYKLAFADKLTKDGERLTFGQPQLDTSIFDPKYVMQMWFMLYDTIYLENDRHLHNVLIADCRYFQYMHFIKTLPWFKSLVDVFFSAYSERIKAVHIVNCPTSLEMAIHVFKRLLPKKIADRFYIHRKVEDLLKEVDEDVVCSDLGGKGPSLEKYKEYTWSRLEKHRKWFLEQNDVRTTKELRRKTSNGPEYMEESVKNLEVD